MEYAKEPSCRSSYNFFKAIFSDDEIMDLHNNCYGRAYASEYPNYSALNAFDLAVRKNELITYQSEVRNSHYRNVWDSEWYTY